MNDKIITVEEAVKEMMNGEIVRMPKDEGTFFAYHEANNLIYMIHYDSLTNRMSISPIDSPSNIRSGKNTFLQGYSENQLTIITFSEIFNEFPILSSCFVNILDKKFKDVKIADDSSMYESKMTSATFPYNNSLCRNPKVNLPKPNIEKTPDTKEKWKEFRSTGLLWFINTILHTFGYAIKYKVDRETGDLLDVYPDRVKFRGFPEESNTKGYIKVSQYMKDNADELLKEAKDE